MEIALADLQDGVRRASEPALPGAGRWFRRALVPGSQLVDL